MLPVTWLYRFKKKKNFRFGGRLGEGEGEKRNRKVKDERRFSHFADWLIDWIDVRDAFEMIPERFLFIVIIIINIIIIIIIIFLWMIYLIYLINKFVLYRFEKERKRGGEREREKEKFSPE